MRRIKFCYVWLAPTNCGIAVQKLKDQVKDEVNESKRLVPEIAKNKDEIDRPEVQRFIPCTKTSALKT